MVIYKTLAYESVSFSFNNLQELGPQIPIYDYLNFIFSACFPCFLPSEHAGHFVGVDRSIALLQELSEMRLPSNSHSSWDEWGAILGGPVMRCWCLGRAELLRPSTHL